MMPDKFTLTAEHITLLWRSYVDADLSDCETGAAWIDPKRPYGDSDVAGDVIEILNWVERTDPDEEYFGGTEDTDEVWRAKAMALHKETPIALQIALCTGKFEPGTYIRPQQYNSRLWELEVGS